MEVRTKGLLLPYRVFSKDQRVSHTAIVENKRLGHALAVIKAQQDTYFTPKMNTNSQKLGYEKRGRNVYGPNYIEPATPIADGPSRREQNSVGQEVANDRPTRESELRATYNHAGIGANSVGSSPLTFRR